MPIKKPVICLMKKSAESPPSWNETTPSKGPFDDKSNKISTGFAILNAIAVSDTASACPSADNAPKPTPAHEKVPKRPSPAKKVSRTSGNGSDRYPDFQRARSHNQRDRMDRRNAVRFQQSAPDPATPAPIRHILTQVRKTTFDWINIPWQSKRNPNAEFVAM